MKTLFKGITIFALVSMGAFKFHNARAHMMFASRNLRPYSHPHVPTGQFASRSGTF